MRSAVFVGYVTVLFLVIWSADAGYSLIGSTDISFDSVSIRLADLVLENNKLEFNLMLRSADTKQAQLTRQSFNLDSREFQIRNEITFEDVKSADVVHNEFVVIYYNNTVLQSNTNGTQPYWIKRQTLSDNLCAYGYQNLSSFLYTHINSFQPILASGQEGFTFLISGNGGDPLGIACKSLNEDEVFVFATSRSGLQGQSVSMTVVNNSTTPSSTNYYQDVYQPTLAVNGDYIVYCGQSSSGVRCFDNVLTEDFNPEFLDYRLRDVAATVLNSQIVLVGISSNSSLVLLTYDNERTIVDIAENKNHGRFSVMDAVATDKYVVVGLRTLDPSSRQYSAHIEIYEKNDDVFVPPSATSASVARQTLFLGLTVALTSLATIIP